MPIIANNVIVESDSTPEPIKEGTGSPIVNRTTIDPTHPHVIVNGEAKRIGRTSQYLLDMLSLDK